MSLLKIPDGERTPLYIESLDIVGVREQNKNKSWIFIRGENDPWLIHCDIKT